MTYGAPAPLEERFWRFAIRQRGCWEWAGATHAKGYGLIGAGGKYGGMLQAHRVSWAIHKGPIPDGLCVLHRCDNPPCTNPRHLWLGTKSDNTIDSVKKGRHARAGRALPGERNHRAKLTEDQVRAIRAAPGTHREVAAQFGVSHGAIRDIRQRVNWKHI